MSTVSAVLDQPVGEAAGAVHRVASAQGYAFAPVYSHPYRLTFVKGMSAFSWGSRITVDLAVAPDGRTWLTFTTEETLALIDWGRGRRAADRLIQALGATPAP